MTREEAIKRLEDTFEGWNMWVMDNDSPASKMSKALDMAISALREQPQWISVEERLPDEWRDNSGELVNYLIYMPEYGVDVGNYALPVKTWICMGAPCKVTHWMPLPEPPKEEA